MNKLTNAWNVLSTWVVANPYLTAGIAAGVVLVTVGIVVLFKNKGKKKRKGRR